MSLSIKEFLDSKGLAICSVTEGGSYWEPLGELAVDAVEEMYYHELADRARRKYQGKDD